MGDQSSDHFIFQGQSITYTSVKGLLQGFLGRGCIGESSKRLDHASAKIPKRHTIGVSAAVLKVRDKVLGKASNIIVIGLLDISLDKGSSVADRLGKGKTGSHKRAE